MKKPLPVKIVEALGWVYVALAVLLVGGAVIEVCQSVYCDKSILILFALTPLSLTVGMVLSLRQGRRFWFLLGHTVIGLIGSTVVLLTQNEELVTFAASCLAAPVFVAAPFSCCAALRRTDGPKRRRGTPRSWRSAAVAPLSSACCCSCAWLYLRQGLHCIECGRKRGGTNEHVDQNNNNGGADRTACVPVHSG